MVLLFTKSRSLKRAGYTLLFLAVLAATLASTFTHLVNRWLERNHAAISAVLNDRLDNSIRIGRMHYGLVSGIVVDNVVMGGDVHPSLPSSAHIARLRLAPWFSFIPRPVLYWKIILEKPSFSLKAGLNDILYAGRIIAEAPIAGRQIGPVYVEFKLGSIQIQGGRVALLSPSGKAWRQDFENVQLFAGRRWYGGERMLLSGNVAGNSHAKFNLRARLKNMAPETLDTVIRFDCRQLATSYFEPHLGLPLSLPDEKITAAIKITVKKGRFFSSKGKLALPRFDKSNGPGARLAQFLAPKVRYAMQGEIFHESLRFNKLEIKTGLLKLKGDGDVKFSDQKDSLDITLSSKKISAIKFRPLIDSPRIDSGDVQLYFNMRGSLKIPNPSIDAVLYDVTLRDLESGLSVSKINGAVNLSRNSVTIDDLWLFWGNLPIGLKGWIRNFESPEFNIRFSTYPGQIPTLKSKNPLNIEASITGTTSGELYNVRMSTEWTRFQDGRHEKNIATSTVEGLRAEGPGFRRALRDLPRGFNLRFARLGLEWRDSQGLVTTAPEITSGLLSLRLLGRKIEWKLTEGVVALGRLTADGWAIPDVTGAVWEAAARLNQADAALLSNGRIALTGTLNANGRAADDTKGVTATAHFILNNGALGPLPALEALATKTGIEPLRRLEYKEISGSVTTQPGTLSLDGLKISSESAKITADLKFNNKRVGGLVSAKFQAKAIHESSQLKWLMRYVGSNDWVDFDFRVAGTPSSPRIEWLSGEFKRKVESRLAPWLKNLLAAEIEKKIG